MLDVERNIDRLRREDFVLEIVDIEGKPVPEARVRAIQTGSDFDFGCNCLWLGQKGEENHPYEELLGNLFNLVTTTFCHCDIEPEQGHWRFVEGGEEVFRRPPPDRVAAFARKYGLKVKGQPLLAGSWYPAWAKELNLDEAGIKALCRDYFRRVAERYGDVYDLFDVVNEALHHRQFALYTPELEYVEWALREARSIFPRRVRLELNEGTSYVYEKEVKTGENLHYQLVRKLVDRGVEIDSLGFQFHLWGNRIENHRTGGGYSYDRVAERLAEFAEFGIPMAISEITIPSIIGGGRDEELQAETVGNFYRLFFGTPGMEGVTYWNLCDGLAWHDEDISRGGLTDEFLRKKPAYLALEKLLKREWRTAFETAADGMGKLAFRGFRGKYEITVEGSGTRRRFEVELGRKPAPLKLTLV